MAICGVIVCGSSGSAISYVSFLYEQALGCFGDLLLDFQVQCMSTYRIRYRLEAGWAGNLVIHIIS